MTTDFEKFAADFTGVFQKFIRMILAVFEEKSAENKWLIPAMLVMILTVGLE